jgi:phosphoglycerate dehydrogenase-like enzyme
MNALFLLDPRSAEVIYPPDIRAQLAARVTVLEPLLTRQSWTAHRDILAQAEVLFGGWGTPRLDAELLAAAPRLRHVFYGAGSVRGIVSDAFWERGLTITSSYAANALPVAEYALAQILFSLKLGWRYAREVRALGKYPARFPVPGAFGTTVGLVSLGMIGSLVAQYLQPFAVKVLAYDPFCTTERARELGVTLVTLEELFARSQVVSIHTPWLKETENLLRGHHFAALPPDATVINTSRGAVVCESELIAVLQQRPDLQAVLDVTYPEPPVAGSPLYALPNVVLTPHIAGSMDRECARMGQYVVDELTRYLAGAPFRWAITREAAARMA